MKNTIISDLAAMIAVRNHILIVMNDRNVTNRGDFHPLNKARVEIDKHFVEQVKKLDFDKLLKESENPQPAPETPQKKKTRKPRASKKDNSTTEEAQGVRYDGKTKEDQLPLPLPELKENK